MIIYSLIRFKKNTQMSIRSILCNHNWIGIAIIIVADLQLGLQEKLEAREPLEIDSYFSSTRDRVEKKWAKYEHFI